MECDIHGNADVMLKVGDRTYSCNKKTLAEHSPYFQAMFCSNFVEKDKKLVELKDVDPDAMAILLDSVLKNEIDLLKANNILSVLQASCMLQFESVQKQCLEVIIHQKLSIASCLQTMITAHELDLIDLHRKARAYALWEFTQVRKTDAFLELSALDLEAYLKNNGLNTTEGEFEVFEAGLNWLQFKLSERREYVDLILNCIRFCDIMLSDIKTMLLYPLIRGSENSLLLLKCIENLKVGKNYGNIVEEAREKSITSEDKIKQCECPTGNKNILNNCCGCCRGSGESLTPVEENIPRVINVHSGKSENSSSEDDLPNFTTEVIEMAEKLLKVPSRVLPLFPCVVGHKKEDKGGNTKDIMNSSRKPYLIYFKDERLAQPVPFLHLSKVNDGPLEPTGYKVFNRGQDLYVIGGEYLLGYGNWNKSIWRYDMLKEVWSYETRIREYSRINHNLLLPENESYTWTSKIARKSILSPRRHHSVCGLDENIYIIGGFGRHRVITDTVEIYNVISKSWSRCARLPYSLYSAACCAYKAQIFVFGPQVCVYEPSADSWCIMAQSQNVGFNCAMPYKESIYLTGTYSRELVKFTPPECSEKPHFESVGYFHNNASNTCIINDTIFCFSTDDLDDVMYVEVYSIETGYFKILWDSSINLGAWDLLDFSPKHSIGCFPVIMY